jgi:acetyl-CoA C-acetyltransferase
MNSMARLLANFSDVAVGNPLATRRERFSAGRLATIDADNRWIGFPYTRLMIANAFIDQAAAVVMTSVGKARELCIAESKWIYLHGCSDAHDHWHLSERPDLQASPAIRSASRQALDMAGKTLAELEFLDIYSCFPSAVEISCREIGLSESDPRGLTVTGGLIYFGGPGNNYVTHSISEMMRRLRSSPGSFGMVTANGNYITKHSFGVYSATPPRKPWQRQHPSNLQSQLNALPREHLAESPSGSAKIETFTVMHGRDGPEFSIIFGRLDSTGERFIAKTSSDRNVLLDLQERESLGRPGIVEPLDRLNHFRLSA